MALLDTLADAGQDPSTKRSTATPRRSATSSASPRSGARTRPIRPPARRRSSIPTRPASGASTASVQNFDEFGKGLRLHQGPAHVSGQLLPRLVAATAHPGSRRSRLQTAPASHAFPLFRRGKAWDATSLDPPSTAARRPLTFPCRGDVKYSNRLSNWNRNRSRCKRLGCAPDASQPRENTLF